MSAARLTFEREPSPDSERLQIESRDRVNDLRELLGRSPIDHRSAPVPVSSSGADRDVLSRLEELQDGVAGTARSSRSAGTTGRRSATRRPAMRCVHA